MMPPRAWLTGLYTWGVSELCRSNCDITLNTSRGSGLQRFILMDMLDTKINKMERSTTGKRVLGDGRALWHAGEQELPWSLRL